MSNFLHRSNEIFYIDIDILLSTDLFVADQIYRYLNAIDDQTDEFYHLKQVVNTDGVGYDNLSNLLQLKSHRNPLLEYMANPSESNANIYYNGILFDDSYTSDSYFSTLTLTRIGSALSRLSKDTNLNKIYVHTPMMTESLFSYVLEIVQEAPKWNFVIGNRDEFLIDHECDNYFISDISTISILVSKRRSKEGNIYVPEYRFNMHPELPFILNSPIEVEKLNKEFNLRIHSIKLPVF